MKAESKNTSLIPAAILCFAIIVTSMTINYINLMSMKPALKQGLCLASLTFLMLSFKPVRYFLTQIPKPHLVIITVFFIFCSVGQLTDRSRVTFPFVKWAMFGKSIESTEVVFFEYRGIQTDGQTVSINPAGLFPSLLHGTGVERLDVMARHALAEESVEHEYAMPMRSIISSLAQRLPAPVNNRLGRASHAIKTFFAEAPAHTPDERRERFNQALQAAGQAYNRSRAAEPVRAIEVFQCTLDIKERHPAVHRTSVWRVDLKEGGRHASSA